MDLDKDLLFILSLEDCPGEYFDNPKREFFFELYWIKEEKPLHSIEQEVSKIKGNWMYLIPPYRSHRLHKPEKNGILIGFNKKILDFEVREFSLDVFKLFNREAQFSTILIEEDIANTLEAISTILLQEYQKNENFILQRTLLKAFLLKLISYKAKEFTSPDMNEKRIHHFFLLLEKNFITERKTDFYANELNISAKRLNQVLKQKLNKTITQLIHERIILEASHALFISENSIKEIADSLGFEDQSYFSRFYKRMTKQTPEEYQKLIKAQISPHS